MNKKVSALWLLLSFMTAPGWAQIDGILINVPDLVVDDSTSDAVPINERVVSKLPVLSWDWSMPDRYGPTVDINKNGIVDLPNSREYVMNLEAPINGSNGCPLHQIEGGIAEAQYKVRLDASESSPLVLQTKTISGLNTQGKQTVSVPESQPDAPIYRWFIELADGSVKESHSSVQSLCLPEGRHKISVEMSQTAQVGHALNLAKRRWVVRNQRYINVVDHLIVLMGDSFAAGEGAPEKIPDFEFGDKNGVDAWRQMKFGFRVNADSRFAGDFLYSFPNGARLPAEWADDGGEISTQVNEYKVFDRDADPTKDKHIGVYRLRETAVGRLAKSRQYFTAVLTARLLPTPANLPFTWSNPAQKARLHL